MTCTICQHQTCKRFGYFGKRRIQRWRCNSCKSTFCEPHTRLTRDIFISQPEAAERALRCLLEGCSIRSTERITGLNRNTIMRLLIVAREHCGRFADAKVRRLRPRYLQLDEIWTFVGKKDRHVRQGDSPEFGSQWVFVAIDAQTKFVASYRVGQRLRRDTALFLRDLYDRIEGGTQITTDGLVHYRQCVPEAFGPDTDFAQIDEDVWRLRAV